MSDTLHLYDGTALVLRPWFGGRPRPWAGARDVVRRRLSSASHLAVVIDRTMDTFRRELDPSYKAHRPAAPPDLIAHFDRFEEEVQELGVPVFGSQRFEADDLAATLVRLARAEGLGVVLHSDDKDLFQLVEEDPDVVVSDDPRGRVYDRAGVVAKLGVQPEQVVDFLALVGDASDGVPGVPGVGAKTAARLLEALGSLDALYEDLSRVGSLGFRGARTLPAKLEAGHQAALHARRLVRLVDTADLGPDALERCRVR